MAINVLHAFQVSIYQLLSTEADIRSIIDKIYLSVVQDARYPFLLINILKVENYSKINQSINSVEFEIAAFVKDSSRNVLIKLADKIISVIQVNCLILEDNIVAGLKHKQVVIQHSQDLVTTKLSISYNALLKTKLILL